ncbi:MAG: putative toxin-antitoxin system toxin component, PIN family [Candidatus Brocadiales bacterium]
MEEGGKPSFLILSPKGREALKAELLSVLQVVWERNRGVPEEVVEKEVQEAVRAVLDTNVIVSGIKKKEGTNGQILKATIEGRFQMIISPPILEEVRKILRYERIQKEHLWPDTEIEHFLIGPAFLSELTDDVVKLNVVKEDAQNNVIIVCALEGKASYIVSGDIHLQQLGKHKGTKILPPSLFLQKLKGR